MLSPTPLPRSLQVIADIIGRDAALDLADAYGGIPVYIPLSPTRDHLFLSFLRPAQLAALCASPLGGQWHTMARGPMRDSKRAAIEQLLADGYSLRDVALRMKVSSTYVQTIRRDMKKTLARDAPVQASLLCFS